jgi:hypothetical protein
MTGELRHGWRRVEERVWALEDRASERILRQVTQVGDADTPERYSVTGPGHEYTEHESLDEAIAAAEASLG